jgi:hypothetical protein
MRWTNHHGGSSTHPTRCRNGKRTLLSTDAWAFLNIGNPLCAWATYRGVLVSVMKEPGFVSVMAASALHSIDGSTLGREVELELFRRRHYPDRISRLTGMFCFLDLESAERACAWNGKHFRPEYLAELSLSDAGSKRDRLDSNWLTHASLDEKGMFESHDWMADYWSGTPCPGSTAIWETLVDGRMIVLGTELRQRAYELIKEWFPDSLAWLEIGRQAALVGSDLMNINGWLQEIGDEVELQFYLDMRDANNADILKRLELLQRDGHPLNTADLVPHLENGSFGRVPDLTRLSLRWPKSRFPSVKSWADHTASWSPGWTPVTATWGPPWSMQW